MLKWRTTRASARSPRPRIVEGSPVRPMPSLVSRGTTAAQTPVIMQWQPITPLAAAGLALAAALPYPSCAPAVAASASSATAGLQDTPIFGSPTGSTCAHALSTVLPANSAGCGERRRGAPRQKKTATERIVTAAEMRMKSRLRTSGRIASLVHERNYCLLS